MQSSNTFLRKKIKKETETSNGVKEKENTDVYKGKLRRKEINFLELANGKKEKKSE